MESCRNSPDSFAVLAHQSGFPSVPELLNGLSLSLTSIWRMNFSKFDRHFPYLVKAGHKWWALCIRHVYTSAGILNVTHSMFIVRRMLRTNLWKAMKRIFFAQYPKSSTNSSQGIRGYIFRTAILKFTYFLIKGITPIF
jgi:hypothetical protein